MGICEITYLPPSILRSIWDSLLYVCWVCFSTLLRLLCYVSLLCYAALRGFFSLGTLHCTSQQKPIIQFIWLLFCSHGFITLIDLLEEHLSHAWCACDKNKLMINNDIDDDDNNYWARLSKISRFVSCKQINNYWSLWLQQVIIIIIICWSQTLRQILTIDL